MARRRKVIWKKGKVFRDRKGRKVRYEYPNGKKKGRRLKIFLKGRWN